MDVMKNIEQEIQENWMFKQSIQKSAAFICKTHFCMFFDDEAILSCWALNLKVNDQKPESVK